MNSLKLYIYVINIYIFYLDAAFDSRPFDAILPTEPDLGDRDLDFLGLSEIKFLVIQV